MGRINPSLTDKIDAGTLASLHAAGYLPQIWTPDAGTERARRLVGRSHAYNIKALRDQEMDVARHAEQAYEQFVAERQTRPKSARGRLKPAGL